LGQSFFALGQYNDAAGATELGMKILPQDKWGAVITNFQQLYGKSQDYTDQLRALEKARNEHPSEPGLRVLLGFHYFYLDHAKPALIELDKALQLEPKDPLARQLRNVVAAKLGLPASEAPPTPQGPPPGIGPAFPDASEGKSL
jgi:tetratricopeptide (TPR) repeat protein